MNLTLYWVLALLLAAIYCFISNRVRADVVALLVIVAFVLSGTLSLEEALAGFSDPNIILIGALFVVGQGLVRTGIAYQLGDLLVKLAGNSETRMLIFLMLAVAALGAVMSSTGVVAIFIPVALSVAHRMAIPASRLMMPLGFAGLISGMLTLVATAPNMVINSELMRHHIPGFRFFSFTPFGLLILLAGIGYMLLARRFLPSRRPQSAGQGRHSMRDLVRTYHLTGRPGAWRFSPTPPS